MAVKVLAFDTTTEYLSVCLWDSSNGELTMRTREGPLRHGANLAPVIHEVLSAAGVLPFGLLPPGSVPPGEASPGLSPGAPGPQEAIDLVAVAAGPGSFTGLRIGFATAKGLSASRGANALPLPAVALPTLRALASRRHETDLVLPALDARKGRFYAAIFCCGRRLCPDSDLTVGEVAALIRREGDGRRVLITGFHGQLLARRLAEEGFSLKEMNIVVDEAPAEPLAPTLASMAPTAYEAGEILKPDSGPLYVRRSDAEGALRR